MSHVEPHTATGDPRMKTDNFEDFEKSMLEFGAFQYDGLADDDDPLAHAVIVDPDGGVTMMAITLDMMTPANKPSLILGVCTRIVEVKAVRMAWLVPAYKIAPAPGDNRPPAANFADDDRAVEVFNCWTLDADRASAQEAVVKRNPSGLEPWESRGAPTRGTFVEVPQRALKIVAEESS